MDASSDAHTNMLPFDVGFIGIHTGLYMNVYHIVPTAPLSLDDLNQMIQILRTELLEPLQANCEDFRRYIAMYSLRDMFGEAATVLSESMTLSDTDMSIRILACDSQDIVFRVSLGEQDMSIRLGEEGSITRLTQMFQHADIM